MVYLLRGLIIVAFISLPPSPGLALLFGAAWVVWLSTILCRV